MNNEPNDTFPNPNNEPSSPDYQDAEPMPAEDVTPVTPTEVSTDVTPEESSASAPSPEPTQPPRKSRTLLKAVGLIMLLVIVAVLAGGGAYVSEHSKVKNLEASQKVISAQISALNSTDYPIPAGAVKISGCIPSMGYHYLLKGADKEYGPFIMTNKAGKVIGEEFMAAPDMYTAIPNTNPPVSVIMKNSPTLGWKFNHAEFSYLPEGHPGLLRSHIDVHLFTVSQQQEHDACK